ncbi:MAG: class I SAM-dependent methyltransferase [Proteobacteria bacterium]|nr:class I SAM-dependent methyltransferase [Pseudomonadota bacterium]
MLKNPAHHLLEREREHYDTYAEDEKTFNFFNSFFHTLFFDRYITYLPDTFFRDKLVVDLCCGFSRLLRYAAYKGCQTGIGVDISYNMLQRGQHQKDLWVYTRKLPYDNKITFIQGSIEHVPLKDAVADVACITAAFHHLPDKERFVNVAKRLLKPGGMFIIRDPNGSHYLRVMGNIVGRRWGTLSDDEEAIGYAETITLLVKAGFRIQNIIFFNAVAEINSHLSEIVYKKCALVGLMQSACNLFLYPLEMILEKTALKIVPNLAWAYLIIARKP